MAVATDGYTTYEAKGLRESLADIIYNISPTATPFMMLAGRGKAKARTEEWQIDVLSSAVDTNAVIEGDDVVATAAVPTTRIKNYTQISDKAFTITGTQEVVDKAGRKSELAYQMMKVSKELKTDVEKQVCSNKASVIGDRTTARQSGGAAAWIESNFDYGVGTSGVGGFNASNGLVEAHATDGTDRALTESQVKSVIRDAWTSGGEPTVILTGPFNKQVISAFTGNATRTDKSEDKRLTTSVDVYISDFGTHSVRASRLSPADHVLILSPKMWEVRYLRNFRSWKLAKTGDTEKRQLLVEYTLCSKNEAASGCIADLTSS